MTSEWSQTTLGSIAINEGYGLVDGPFGSNLPASLYTNEGVPVIRGSNLALGTSRFRAKEFVFVSWDTASSPVMKSLSDQSVSGATMMTSIAGLPSMFATMAIARAASN